MNPEVEQEQNKLQKEEQKLQFSPCMTEDEVEIKKCENQLEQSAVEMHQVQSQQLKTPSAQEMRQKSLMTSPFEADLSNITTDRSLQTNTKDVNDDSHYSNLSTLKDSHSKVLAQDHSSAQDSQFIPHFKNNDENKNGSPN